MQNLTIYECYNNYIKNPIEFDKQIDKLKDRYIYLEEWSDLFKCIDKVFYIVNITCVTYNINFHEMNINDFKKEPNTVYIRLFFRSNLDIQRVWKIYKPDANNYTFEMVFNDSIVCDNIKNITISLFDEYIRFNLIHNGLSTASLKFMIETNK